MLVRDVMTRDVFTCAQHSTAEDAGRIMWEGDVGVVPVVDPQGIVLGIVTDRDIFMACYTRGLRPADFMVGSVVSRPPVTCAEDQSVGAAADLMRTHQIRRLPVTDASGRLVGILSLSDIALHQAESSLGRFDEVSEVLASICRKCKDRSPAGRHVADAPR